MKERRMENRVEPLITACYVGMLKGGVFSDRPSSAAGPFPKAWAAFQNNVTHLNCSSGQMPVTCFQVAIECVKEMISNDR